MSLASLRRWLLLEGDRSVLAALLLVAIYAVVLGLATAGVLDLGDPDAVRGLGGGLIPGLFTFLSIVLAINQLVLSQTFGSAGEVREQVREVRGFRLDVEDAAGADTSPILPTAFLELVVRTVAAKAALVETSRRDELATADAVGDATDSDTAGDATDSDTVGDRSEDAVDGDAIARDADVDPTDGDASGHRRSDGPEGDPIHEFAASVLRDARDAADHLDRREAGRINAVLAVLEYPDARQVHEARRLVEDRGDDCSAATREALEELVAALEQFSVARTHFRSTYTQRVLARLSRRLLYVGVPALVAAAFLVLLAETAPAPLERYRSFVIAGLLVAALSPLALLSTYILRIATVSERTVGVGPFVSRPGGEDHAGDDEARSGGE